MPVSDSVTFVVLQSFITSSSNPHHHKRYNAQFSPAGAYIMQEPIQCSVLYRFQGPMSCRSLCNAQHCTACRSLYNAGAYVMLSIVPLAGLPRALAGRGREADGRAAEGRITRRQRPPNHQDHRPAESFRTQHRATACLSAERFPARRQRPSVRTCSPVYCATDWCIGMPLAGALCHWLMHSATG